MSTHVIDTTPACEFSVEYDGSLVIRGTIVAQPSSEFTKDDIARIVAAMNGAREITEAQVVAWLWAQMDGSGLPNVNAIVSLRQWLISPRSTRIILECDGVQTASGGTFGEAVADALRQIKTPAQQAAEKRAAAAKLLAEADAIAPQN